MDADQTEFSYLSMSEQVRAYLCLSNSLYQRAWSKACHDIPKVLVKFELGVTIARSTISPSILRVPQVYRYFRDASEIPWKYLVIE